MSCRSIHSALLRLTGLAPEACAALMSTHTDGEHICSHLFIAVSLWLSSLCSPGLCFTGSGAIVEPPTVFCRCQRFWHCYDISNIFFEYERSPTTSYSRIFARIRGVFHIFARRVICLFSSNKQILKK